MMLNKWIYESKLGYIGIAEYDGKIKNIILPTKDKKELDKILYSLDNNQNLNMSEIIKVLISKLDNYFNGIRENFKSIKIDTRNKTDFQKKVIDEVRNIDYGQTASYSDIAKNVGSPKAHRAVGNVMANNEIPIIVPCHRVVKIDKSLGGFSGGLDMKIELLKLEGVKLLNA
ncbi:MAG: methylated-DNA--[protein]-cysteine S-methyltransferase [Armatimonadota bacterium]